jgi:hypothetical protein
MALACWTMMSLSLTGAVRGSGVHFPRGFGAGTCACSLCHWVMRAARKAGRLVGMAANCAAVGE